MLILSYAGASLDIRFFELRNVAFHWNVMEYILKISVGYCKVLSLSLVSVITIDLCAKRGVRGLHEPRRCM